MNVLEKLTQRQLKKILLNITQKGNETENMNVNDVIDDIKQQVLTVIKN